MTKGTLVEILQCECKPGFTWASTATFRAHFKSQRHSSWVTTRQELEHRKTVTRLQIELDKARYECQRLKDTCLKLVYELDAVKQECAAHYATVSQAAGQWAGAPAAYAL